MNQNEPSVSPEEAKSPKAANVGRNRRVSGRRVVIFLLVVVASSIPALLYWSYSLPPMPIPQVDLEGVYPPVAEAISDARQRVADEPRSAQAWGELGMILHAHEYYAEAIRCYQMANRFDPTEFRWSYFHANLVEADDRPTAVEAYRRAIRIKPEIAQLRIRYAELLMDLGEVEEAETQLKTAAELAPRKTQAQFRLAQLAMQRGDDPQALKWAEMAAEEVPPRREVHELLLQLYARANESEKVAYQENFLRTAVFASGYWPDRYFEELKALRRDPLWQAFQAKQMLARDEVEEALVILERLRADRPDDRAVCEQLAHAYMQLGDLDTAAEVLEAGLKQSPESFELHRLQGAVRMLDGQWQPAADSFRAALKLKPDDPSARQDLGYCLAQLGEEDAAIAEFRETLRYKPDTLAARLEIAKLLIKQDKSADAEAELEIILQLVPDHPVALELIKQVQGEEED